MKTGKLSHQAQSLIATIGLAAVAVCYLCFFFLPKQKAIAKLRTQLADQNAYLQSTGAVAVGLAKTEAEVADVQKFVTQWKEKAPTEKKLASLFGEIARRAKTARVSMARFDPQPVVNRRALTEVPLNVAVEGDFAEIFAFLRMLESMPVALWVRQMRIEAAGGGSPDRSDERDPRMQRIASKSLTCELTLVIFADRADFSD